MQALRQTAKTANFKLLATRVPRASRYSTAMGAAVGDAIPAVTMYGATPGDEVNLAEYVGSKTVVMFGVPGAFTPGCSMTHLPGYIEKADEFKSAGVDEIICTAVNDPFVMDAWGKDQKAEGKVTLLADTQMTLTNAMDIVLDAEGKLGNKRMKRFSAVLKDGKIASLNVEADGAGLACSLAEVALDQVKAM